MRFSSVCKPKAITSTRSRNLDLQYFVRFVHAKLMAAGVPVLNCSCSLTVANSESVSPESCRNDTILSSNDS